MMLQNKACLGARTKRVSACASNLVGVRTCVCVCARVCVRCGPQGAWNYGLSPTDDSVGQTRVGEFAYVYIS